MTWTVVRRLEGGRWHLVSTISFATQARAFEHLEFVRASVRKSLRSDYVLARIVIDDPARVEMPVPNRTAGPTPPLFDWGEEVT